MKHSIGFLMGVISMMFFNMGMDWILIGEGIHPAIAFPVATLGFTPLVLALASYALNREMDN